MVRLEDLIGKEVWLALAKSKVPAYRVTLHGAESGGIWVESKELEKMLGHRRPKATGLVPSTKPVFFCPYSAIDFVIAYSTVL